jgi:hypothetical protein
VPRQKSRPAASLSGNQSSFTKGLSLSRRTHTTVDPPAPALLRRNTPVATPRRITDPGHSARGPRLTRRLTLICQRLRYLKPLQEHHLRLAETKIIAALCINSKHPTPMSPLHLPADTDVAHFHFLCAQATPPNIHHQHCLKLHATGLIKRRLQGGCDADGATAASPVMDRVFTLRTSCCKTKHPTVAPSIGQRHPRTPPPSPPTSAGEDFRLACLVCCTHKLVTETTPRRLWQCHG